MERLANSLSSLCEVGQMVAMSGRGPGDICLYNPASAEQSAQGFRTTGQIGWISRTDVLPFEVDGTMATYSESGIFKVTNEYKLVLLKDPPE